MLTNPEKLKLIFFSPKVFYQRISDEKGYVKPLFFYAVLFLIVSIFDLILETTAVAFTGNIALIIVQIIGIFFSLFFYVAAAFIIPFISSFVTYLGLLILGVKCDFERTFKVVTYAAVVSIFYSFLTALIVFIFQLLFPGIIVGDYDNMALAILIIFVGLIFLLSVFGLIHVIVVEVVGLVNEYNISAGKAFFAVILIPLLLFLILVIFVIIFVVLLGVFSASFDSANITGMITSFVP